LIEPSYCLLYKVKCVIDSFEELAEQLASQAKSLEESLAGYKKSMSITRTEN